MNKQKLSIIIAAGLGILATFMPWISTRVGSITGIDTEYGWVILLLFMIPIIICLVNDHSKRINGGALYGVIIPPFIAALFVIWKILEFKFNIGDTPFSNAFSIGYGFYLVPFAGISIPVIDFLSKIQLDDDKEKLRNLEEKLDKGLISQSMFDYEIDKIKKVNKRFRGIIIFSLVILVYILCIYFYVS